MSENDAFGAKKISIIVPVYNCKNYLRQAVESVINQPYQEIRIILVDDGSRDGSSVLCDELAEQYDRVTALHQENDGVASARNKGIEYVLSLDKNGYVTFWDADDMWVSNCINERVSQIIEKNYDLIGLQACTCDHLMRRHSKPISMQEGVHQGGVASVWIHAEQCMGAMLYRTELIQQYDIRFYLIKASEDKIFSLQCLYLADSIYLENQLMYLYRHNITSAVHRRETGIPYFMPIIDAYIKLDVDMAQWKNCVRGELNEGKLLAKIYIMDMAEEEYEKRDGARHIRDLLVQRKDYQAMIERITGNAQVDKRWLYMESHEQKLVLKNRTCGLVNKIARSVYYFPLVKKYIDRKRFPIKI